jgi:hypothetical protein
LTWHGGTHELGRRIGKLLEQIVFWDENIFTPSLVTLYRGSYLLHLLELLLGSHLGLEEIASFYKRCLKALYDRYPIVIRSYHVVRMNTLCLLTMWWRLVPWGINFPQEILHT